jgi:AraC-like DNA-binding protein
MHPPSIDQELVEPLPRGEIERDAPHAIIAAGQRALTCVPIVVVVGGSCGIEPVDARRRLCEPALVKTIQTSPRARIDQLLEAAGAARMTRLAALAEARSIAAGAGRSRSPELAAQAWLACVRLLLELGDHAESRRVLETAKLWSGRTQDAAIRSEALFCESELLRSMGALVDAVTVCLRHIDDRSLLAAPGRFRAYQSLLACYIDNGDYLLAATYAEAIRANHFERDSWAAWALDALAAGAYLSLAQAGHPVNDDLLEPLAAAETAAAEQPWWLGKAQALLDRLAPDPAWLLSHANWEVDRRALVGQRLHASYLAQTGDSGNWATGIALVRASLAGADPRMAMVVGLGLFQSMVHGSAAAQALPLLVSIRGQWRAAHGGDPMLRQLNYLLSKAYRALGQHEEAHRCYRDYARAASVSASTRGELPRLPDSLLCTEPSAGRAGQAQGLPAYLRSAVERVQSELGSAELSVQALATKAGVTPRTMLAVFRRHFGVSPARYIEQTRLAKAHTLLASACSSHTVAEVAKQCGFTHAGRFATAYRKRYGQSPADRQRASRAARADA